MDISYLKSLFRLLGVLHAVSAVHLATDGLDLGLQRVLERVQELEGTVLGTSGLACVSHSQAQAYIINTKIWLIS